ncbi:hypothetical protein C2845_PM11G17610 [Panicum miliaceum]|uniref:Late embryogenesis abundant protein LEA-2 subgroup domain-containing protein n=1 Tax=Panicum miliaceum TaxID=4540 RepID=A0A3L6RU26_PANMI|nr:hypothetical protein C2845_PM11G17610 [Panicum miliaceum]
MATETIPPPSDSRWRVRHFILAAVGCALVAIAIVAAISISLAPAHISFSIANATLSFPSHAYNLTITANNTSRRPEVMYDFMSAEIWTDPTTSFLAEVNRTEARQGPRSAASFSVLVDYRQYDLTTDNSTKSGNDSDCKVVVVARVRFRIGHAVPTRPYTISATCWHVNFLSRHNASDFPVECAMY